LINPSIYNIEAIAFFLFSGKGDRVLSFFIHCIGKVRSQQKSQPAPNKIPTAFLKNLWKTAFAVGSFHRTKHLAPVYIHLQQISSKPTTRLNERILSSTGFDSLHT